MRPTLLPMLALLVAGCAATGSRPPVAIAPPPVNQAGLDRVMGHDARALMILFGEPDLDVREGKARKLQFSSPACVLDTYLYPAAPDALPVTTYTEARTPSGDPFDRASCIAAIARRPQAR